MNKRKFPPCKMPKSDIVKNVDTLSFDKWQKMQISLPTKWENILLVAL